MRLLKIVALLALLGVVFLVGWIAGGHHAAGSLRDLRELDYAVRRIRGNYVDDVAPNRLVAGALRGMLRTLDPHSTYLDRSDFDNLEDATQGQFEGLGIVVEIRDHYPTVISPLQGTPAWRVGLRAADRIVAIDGTSTLDWTSNQTVRRLRGRAGSKVRLTVEREGQPGKDYQVTRARIDVRTVPYAFMTRPGVGYVRLTQFSERSHEEITAALDTLERQGMTSLVLDLRDNPGGLLDQAVGIAEEWVPAGKVIVSTRGRTSDQNKTFTSRARRVRGPYPMVVLVNGGTASASEVLAGALQDLDLAVVVGFTSFGKGSVQSVFPLDDSTAVKLTVARYYTPSGRSIHREDHDRELLALEGEDSAASAILRRATGGARPTYRTAGGRVVRGGGGIVPDVTVPDTSFSELMGEVARKGLLFRLATRYVASHPDPGPGSAWRNGAESSRPLGAPGLLTAAEVAAFRDSLAAATGARAMRTWPSDSGRLTGLLQAEIARRYAGDAAGQRMTLESDPAAQEAFQLLSRARTWRELLERAAADSAPARPPVAHATRALRGAHAPGAAR
jgi:carboxyl-terminal processing protease